MQLWTPKATTKTQRIQNPYSFCSKPSTSYVSYTTCLGILQILHLRPRNANPKSRSTFAPSSVDDYGAKDRSESEKCSRCTLLCRVLRSWAGWGVPNMRVYCCLFGVPSSIDITKWCRTHVSSAQNLASQLFSRSECHKRFNTDCTMSFKISGTVWNGRNCFSRVLSTPIIGHEISIVVSEMSIIDSNPLTIQQKGTILSFKINLESIMDATKKYTLLSYNTCRNRLIFLGVPLLFIVDPRGPSGGTFVFSEGPYCYCRGATKIKEGPTSSCSSEHLCLVSHHALHMQDSHNAHPHSWMHIRTLGIDTRIMATHVRTQSPSLVLDPGRAIVICLRYETPFCSSFFFCDDYHHPSSSSSSCQALFSIGRCVGSHVYVFSSLWVGMPVKQGLTSSMCSFLSVHFALLAIFLGRDMSLLLNKGGGL